MQGYSSTIPKLCKAIVKAILSVITKLCKANI